MSDKPGDESLPDGSPYAAYPAALMETLRRSYRERRPGSWHVANGFAGENESPKTKSFSQVLDNLGTACMESLRRVYLRAAPFPDLWAQVGTIRECWPPGTSEGFFFNTKTADVMRRILLCAFGKRARPEEAAPGRVVGPFQSRRACRAATPTGQPSMPAARGKALRPISLSPPVLRRASGSRPAPLT
jgi:hypothetical protein